MDTIMIEDLEAQLKHHDLKGIEITEEDVCYANELLEKGVQKHEAIDTVLSGIRETLDEGLNDEDD